MTAAPTPTLVIADDHPVIRRGLVELFQADFRIVATCKDGEEAIQAVREHQPDLLILDVSMPKMTGLNVLDTLRSELVKTKVLLLTAMISDDDVSIAVARGANGILLKDTEAEVLVKSVELIQSGKSVLPPELVDAAQLRASAQRIPDEKIEQHLTPRERDIVLLVAEGMSNKHVARKLDRTEGTIKVHLHKIYQKLGVSNRTSLTALALTNRGQLLEVASPARTDLSRSDSRGK